MFGECDRLVAGLDWLLDWLDGEPYGCRVVAICSVCCIFGSCADVMTLLTRGEHTGLPCNSLSKKA